MKLFLFSTLSFCYKIMKFLFLITYFEKYIVGGGGVARAVAQRQVS